MGCAFSFKEGLRIHFDGTGSGVYHDCQRLNAIFARMVDHDILIGASQCWELHRLFVKYTQLGLGQIV